MRTIVRTAILLVIVLAAVGSQLSAAASPIINYQGNLLQPSGAPVADGTYQMQFAIYDVPTGGTPLWSETNRGVQVKGGLFAVLLGSTNNFGPNLFDSQNRWFGVKVGADPEMTPRQQIAWSAFAIKASSADVATTVPDGAITTAKISDGAVTSEKIADTSVGVGKIADASVTADKLALGAVTADKIAPSAIALGYAQVTTPQGGIGAQTDLVGLSVTVNVPSGERLVKVTGYGLFDSGGIGNKSQMFIYEGATPLQEAAVYNSTAVGGGSSQSVACIAIINPTAGTHTYRLRASASAFSALVADSSRPAFILVELI